MNNPFETIDKRLNFIEALLIEIKHTRAPEPKKEQGDPLDDFIEKKDVIAKKFASASTLWKWEKAGKIQSYGIGGKRFYKRSELMGSFKKMK